MNEISPGRYRHYKGNDYTVIGVAQHSETEEELVVYRPEYGARGLWVRPKSMFAETVLVGGRPVARFSRLPDEVPATSDVSHKFGNLLDDIPSQLPHELVQTLLQRPSLRVERIVSQGQASPAGFWYDQDHGELVLLMAGAARLELPDRLVELRAGDVIDIPAHQRHRVAWTSPDEPTVWLTVHYREQP